MYHEAIREASSTVFPPNYKIMAKGSWKFAIPANVFISLVTADLSVDLPGPSLATRNMTTPNIKIQDEYISFEQQEEIIDEQVVLELPTVKKMWFKISRVEPLSLEVIEDKDDYV
ncbi:hypothetical protein ES703_115564 [subsurface metagenome]